MREPSQPRVDDNANFSPFRSLPEWEPTRGSSSGTRFSRHPAGPSSQQAVPPFSCRSARFRCLDPMRRIRAFRILMQLLRAPRLLPGSPQPLSLSGASSR